jgi:anthranilate synthase component 2
MVFSQQKKSMHSILLIDNHDSFTYNLREVFLQTQLCTVDVVLLEDAQTLDLRKYQGIVLSPGPGLPIEKKGLNQRIAVAIKAQIPLLGVCLGHQALAQYFGAQLVQLQRIIHGESAEIFPHGDDNLYTGCTFPLQVGRYHSWILNEATFPIDLQVTSTTSEGLIMSFKHKKLNIHGVQYHPESILTPMGRKLLSNWLKYSL